MITIIGVGALGSHVALLLRNEKPGLFVMDFDHVEQKNILAQFHTKMGLGRNKTVALYQTLQGLFGVKIEISPNKLIPANSLLLKDTELVIDCTDNMSARATIMEACKRYGTPCVHGALSADGTFARVLWAEDFVPDSEGDVGGATCIDGEHLPFFVLAAAYLALEVQNFLKTGKKRSWQITPTGVTRLV